MLARDKKSTTRFSPVVRRMFLALLVATAPLSIAKEIAISSTPAGAEKHRRANLPELSNRDQFFDFMGIPIDGAEVAHYVVGDNNKGYAEGLTKSGKDKLRYRTKNELVLGGFASYVNDQYVGEAVAIKSYILPFGSQRVYPQARESWLMHSRQNAVSMRVEIDASAELSIAPMLAQPLSAYVIETIDNVVVFSPKHPLASSALKPHYIAVSSAEPFHLRSPKNAQATAMVDAPRVISAESQKQFTIHLVFGEVKADAIQRAKSLASVDSWEQERERVFQRLTKSLLWTSDARYNQALLWAEASAYSFVVDEFGRGIWAGLPWFRDNWGRDTFIALPGTLLTTGLFDDAKAVLNNFAQYQQLNNKQDSNYGRIPNRVSANAPIIYNTVDGTPWMIREALEYIRYSGDLAYAKKILPVIDHYIDGVRTHWLDKNGLLTHDDADTWMDARIDNHLPWSARGNRAVEIQALWFNALYVASELHKRFGDQEKAKQYGALAEQTKTNFTQLFWDGKLMADRVRADDTRDTKVRPNQLMLISVPFNDFVSVDMQAKILGNAVSRLLYPYGIASLDPKHGYFHPRHENPEFHHKDAAYHNGTVWGWNAGFTITALNKFGYQDLSWQLSKNLSEQILHLGTRGSMSELLNALPITPGELHPSGTYAQSWSVAEFVRNAYQDYLGFRPNLLDGVLFFEPAIPDEWTHFSARLPFGNQEELFVEAKREAGTWHWRFQSSTVISVQMNALTRKDSRVAFKFTVNKESALLSWNGTVATLNNKTLSMNEVMPTQRGNIGELRFVQPEAYRPASFDMLKEKDALKQIIERGEFQ